MMLCALILLSAGSYAQSNGPTAADPPVQLPACPTLEGVDANIAAALDQYCRLVVAAHHALVDRAVTAAAAAALRDIEPKLAAAQAAADEARRRHGACTIEGAILGAGLTLGASLLGAHLGE